MFVMDSKLGGKLQDEQSPGWLYLGPKKGVQDAFTKIHAPNLAGVVGNSTSKETRGQELDDTETKIVLAMLTGTPPDETEKMEIPDQNAIDAAMAQAGTNGEKAGALTPLSGPGCAITGASDDGTAAAAPIEFIPVAPTKAKDFVEDTVKIEAATQVLQSTPLRFSFHPSSPECNCCCVTVLEIFYLVIANSLFDLSCRRFDSLVCACTPCAGVQVSPPWNSVENRFRSL